MIFLHPLVPFPQVPQLPGKLYKVARFMIPSANPAIPFASSLAMVSYNSEKVLWETAIVMPIGADGRNIFLFAILNFHFSSKSGTSDSRILQ